MRQRKRPLRLDRPNVVGVIQSRKAFALAAALAPRILDAIEIRLDLLGAATGSAKLPALRTPVIATARHPREGGAPGLTSSQRSSLYRGALGIARAIDVELASLAEMAAVVAEARAADLLVILSVHDFQKTPDPARMRGLMLRAMDAGADVFKIAVTPRGPRDLGALIELLDRPPLPVAAMGMGPYGKLSRLLCGSCGSVLNYGWIERAAASGQWPAAEMRRLLDEMASERA